MCVEDWNIPQSFQSVLYPVTTSGASTDLTLPANNARVGIMVLGPTTSNLTIKAGTSTNKSRIAVLTTTSDTPNRFITLKDHGPIVQLELYFTTGAAAEFQVWEYLWPLNPEQRQFLAKTGGF